MDIKVRTPQLTSQRPTHRPSNETKTEEHISPALDGFSYGANVGSDVVVGGGGIMAGMLAVGGLLYQTTGNEALAIPVGLLAGGLAGLAGGRAVSRGLDAVGAKLDSSQPQRGALLAKTAAIGVTAALLGGAGGALESLAIVGAFGAIGAAVGQWGPK